MLHDQGWTAKINNAAPPTLENIAIMLGRLNYGDMRELAELIAKKLGEQSTDSVALALFETSKEITMLIPKQAPQVGLRNISENPDV